MDRSVLVVRLNRNDSSIKRYLCVLSKGFTNEKHNSILFRKKKYSNIPSSFFFMTRQQPDPPYYFTWIKYPNEDDEQK